MSDLARLCDELLACTHATLALIEGESPELGAISLRVQERTALFSKIYAKGKAPKSSEDAHLLTQLATQLEPMDAKILSWMQTTQDSVVGALRKVRQDVHNTRSPSEAKILIQDA